MPEPMLFVMARAELVKRINALDPVMRAYIHELESKCDPSGDIRTIADLREQVRALSSMIERIRGVMSNDNIDVISKTIHVDRILA